MGDSLDYISNTKYFINKFGYKFQNQFLSLNWHLCILYFSLPEVLGFSFFVASNKNLTFKKWLKWI